MYAFYNFATMTIFMILFALEEDAICPGSCMQMVSLHCLNIRSSLLIECNSRDDHREQNHSWSFNQLYQLIIENVSGRRKF